MSMPAAVGSDKAPGRGCPAVISLLRASRDRQQIWLQSGQSSASRPGERYKVGKRKGHHK